MIGLVIACAGLLCVLVGFAILIITQGDSITGHLLNALGFVVAIVGGVLAWMLP